MAAKARGTCTRIGQSGDPETYFGLKNGDKVLALIIWYGHFASNLYFQFKVFGNANYPCVSDASNRHG